MSTFQVTGNRHCFRLSSVVYVLAEVNHLRSCKCGMFLHILDQQTRKFHDRLKLSTLEWSQDGGISSHHELEATKCWFVGCYWLSASNYLSMLSFPEGLTIFLGTSWHWALHNLIHFGYFYVHWSESKKKISIGEFSNEGYEHCTCAADEVGVYIFLCDDRINLLICVDGSHEIFSVS